MRPTCPMPRNFSVQKTRLLLYAAVESEATLDRLGSFSMQKVTCCWKRPPHKGSGSEGR